MARAFALLLVLGMWTWVFARVWMNPDGFQADFKTYHVAVHTYEIGQNPYDVETLREVAQQPKLLGFYYPLSVLHLMRPIGHLDYPAAHRVWLLLKLAAMVALLFIWKRFFLEHIDWLIVLGGALLAFNAAAVWDIKMGNVTVFEQLFLWSGFACFTSRRMTLFAVCVVLASMAKLLPAVFLCLLFLPAVRSRGNTVRFVAAVAALAAITLLPFRAMPAFFDSLRNLASQHPALQHNQSIAGLIDELGRFVPVLQNGWVHGLALVVCYGALLAASWRLLRIMYRQEELGPVLLVAAMGYADFAPRLSIYSYMIAIVPVLALLVPALARSATAGWLLIALCIGGLAVVPDAVGEVAGKPVALILLLFCWLWLIDLMGNASMEEPGEGTEHLIRRHR